MLEKNKFTPREGSLNHEVRDIRFRTATDEQGAYDFLMEPGKYRWTATSADGRFARGEVSLDAGDVHDLGASLRRGNDVMLELHDIQTGQPVPGIEVCIMEKVGFASIANRPGSERTSDPEGRMRWENLLPGETQFEAWSLRPSPLASRKQAPYARWWLASKAPDHYASQPPTGGNGVDSLRANVGDDLSSPVRVLLERGVKISGSVVGPDGKGLGGVNVLLNTEHGGLTADLRMSARTEADGSFLAYLPAGNGLAYQLCAAFPPWTEDAPAANVVSERFDSWPGDERTFHLVMGKGGWFTGRLVTAAGGPAAGFKVTAVAVDGQDPVYAARIVTAGTNGGFRLGPLRPGKYKVFPGAGPGAPLGKLPGTTEITGEIGAEDDTRDLGSIDLPASARLPP